MKWLFNLFRPVMRAGELRARLDNLRLLFLDSERRIMADINQVKDGLATLGGKVTLLNKQNDLLLQGNADLKAQIAKLQGAGGATPADLQDLLDTIGTIGQAVDDEAAKDTAALAPPAGSSPDAPTT